MTTKLRVTITLSVEDLSLLDEMIYVAESDDRFSKSELSRAWRLSRQLWTAYHSKTAWQSLQPPANGEPQ